MEETARLISSELSVFNRILESLSVFEDGTDLKKYCLDYLEEKLAAPHKPLRAYFCRKLYEYLKQYPEFRTGLSKINDPDRLFLQKLPFIFEVIVTIQYLHNHILDEKYGTKAENHPKIIKNLISSNVIRELLFQYIEEEVNIHFQDYEKMRFLSKSIRNLLNFVDIGQYTDKEYNSYENWRLGVPKVRPDDFYYDDIVKKSIGKTIQDVREAVPDHAPFVNAYFARIYLSNVYFFRCVTETVTTLCEYRGKQYVNLLIFSTKYGFMLQIINDYADFAYVENKRELEYLKTAGKKTTDFFADLYNYNITLPLIFHLNKGYRRKIESYLEGGKKTKKILNQYTKQIMQEIRQSHAIEETINISKDLAKSAKDYLDTQNNQYKYFENMCDMAVDNKFIKLFTNQPAKNERQ